MKERQTEALTSGRLDSAGQAIQREASAWIALRQARNLTLKERADLADWLAKNPRHAIVFAEVERCWTGLDQLSAVPHSDDLPPDPDLWDLLNAPSDPSLRKVTDEWVRPVLTNATLARRLLNTRRTGHVARTVVEEGGRTL